MKKYFILLFSAALFLLSITLVFSLYAGSNPFSQKHNNAHIMIKLLPEGWGFFTRNPREDIYRFYQCKDGFYKEIDMSNSAPETLLGFSKKHRRLNLEFQRMKFLVPDSIYMNKQPLNCAIGEAAFELIDERGFDYYFLKDGGNYAVSVEKIKPWLYANKNINYDTEFKIAKIKFTNK